MFPQDCNVIDLGYGLGTGIFTSTPSDSVGGDNGGGEGGRVYRNLYEGHMD